MDRLALSDAMWARLAPYLPGKPGDPGRSAADNRLFAAANAKRFGVEAVLWMARAGAPWRDLPSSLGPWNSVFRRFRRWAKGGVLERVLAVLGDEPDFEYVVVDGIIRVQRAQKGDCPPGDRALARSASAP